MCITSLGNNVQEARQRAYHAYDAIRYTGKFCRTDIGARRAARAQDETAAAPKRPARDPRLRAAMNERIQRQVRHERRRKEEEG
jgi:hypothetical protein